VLEMPRVIKSGAAAALPPAFPQWAELSVRPARPPVTFGRPDRAQVSETTAWAPRDLEAIAPGPSLWSAPPDPGSWRQADQPVADDWMSDPGAHADAANPPAVSEALQRADALERRAAALLAEAEEVAAAKLAEAAQQVEAIVAEATAEAERLFAQAREAGLAEGRQQGYEAGYQEGMRQAQEDGALVIEQAWADADAITNEARAMAEETARRAESERSALLAQSERQILELALGVARLILRREVQTDPQAIVPAVRAALQKLKGETEPKLRVAPEWVPFLTAHLPSITSGLPGAPALKVEGDPGLAPGDWTVTGRGGWVDGRLEAQVRQVEERLRREGL
jgi:flagellar assembly protein FliH